MSPPAAVTPVPAASIVIVPLVVANVTSSAAVVPPCAIFSTDTSSDSRMLITPLVVLVTDSLPALISTRCLQCHNPVLALCVTVPAEASTSRSVSPHPGSNPAWMLPSQHRLQRWLSSSTQRCIQASADRDLAASRINKCAVGLREDTADAVADTLPIVLVMSPLAVKVTSVAAVR